MPSRLGEPRKRTGAARFAGQISTALTADEEEEVPSKRLAGDNSKASADDIQNDQSLDTPPAKVRNGEILETPAKYLATSSLAVKAAKPQKRAVAIRLTDDALRRLLEIETSLRGSGFSAHQASASEIVMALLDAADIGDLRERLGRRFGRDRSR